MPNDQTTALTPCTECGMLCSPTEFHPFAACLMFKGCHDGDKVRANLASVQVPADWVCVPRHTLESAVENMRSADHDERTIDARWRIASKFAECLSATPSTPQAAADASPIDMVLHCPSCGVQHIDAPEQPTITSFGYAWKNPPHRSHLCHGCGHIWRPADVPTNGVAAIKTRGQNDSPAAPSEPEAQKAVAWHFECIKPGKRWSFASVFEDDTTHWPLDQWKSVIKRPLVFAAPSPAASMEVQGHDEAWTRAMNAALTYRNHDPEAMDEQDAWANLVNAIGALAGRLGEGRG